MERKIRISAVRYANTYPFLYGLARSGFDQKIELTTDHPAECAAKLKSGSADIGLVPVAALPGLDEYHIITDYCLGSYGKVNTVMLLSNCPLEQVKTIFLDYRSMSSVTLVKILARKFWKRDFTWKDTDKNTDFLNIPCDTAIVLIGDQCFEYSGRYSFRTDLSEEWSFYTGLPFAFACWTSNKRIENEFIAEFNSALALGVDNIKAVVDEYGATGIIKGRELYTYLTENMNYILNSDKRKAIELFIDFMKEI